MRRREFLIGAVGAGWLAGQTSELIRESLAYVAGGGLWIRDLPDGWPQRVASGAGIGSPRISPSGEWIAYRQGNRACVVPRNGGAAPRILGEGASQWRTGRDELLVEQARGLSVFTAANGWLGPVRSIPDASLPVAFSPEAGEMVYGQRTAAGIGILRRVGVDAAGAARTVLSRNGDGLVPYAWIGDALLYWVDPSFSASVEADGLELFRVPAAGGVPRSLGISTLVHDDFLALSPAGDRLAVTAGGGRESWHNKRIAWIDLASGTMRYLTDERTAAICPSWSPDGQRIALVAAPESAERHFLGQRRIFVADVSGTSAPVRLTGDDRYRDEEPIWLADGRHILFCRIDCRPAEGAPKSVWLMDDRGGDLSQIAGPLQANDTFEGEGWFGYYGTTDWQAVMGYHPGKRA
jgi:hypothetical protein